MDLAYRIVNVFTVGDDPFSGNPLAVFEDAADVSDEQMQSIARQLNLSETTFVTGPGGDGVDADVRIFTPEYELPFAGHPTLGTAYVVSSLLSGREDVVLGMPAGRVPVSVDGSRWVLTTAVAADDARRRRGAGRPRRDDRRGRRATWGRARSGSTPASSS